jgi:predicted nucleotidyltransferase
MKQTLTLEKRKATLDLIKDEILKELDSEILSATVYGSTLSEDFGYASDFDILLIFDDQDLAPAILETVLKVRRKFKEDDINIDFNIHKRNELPQNRCEVFWHNNRAIYMQKEIALYGFQLIGEDMISNSQIQGDEIRNEAVRVIHSLHYQTRKLIMKGDINNEQKLSIIKYCLYAVMYALAFENIFPASRMIAYQSFTKDFNFSKDPMNFLNIKLNNPFEITDSNILEAYSFLANLDDEIFNRYKFLTLK